jgi:hypothetical protein
MRAIGTGAGWAGPADELMSAESKAPHEDFLSRWSRRKVEGREIPAGDLQDAPATRAAEDAAPELPPVDELTIDSDFRGFFHPKVGEDVRRAALRKLFSDPHFNVMDGLDTYIDDYSKNEPIPPAMLAGLRQAQRILNWAEGKDEPVEDAPDNADALPNAGAAGTVALAADASDIQPAAVASLVPPVLGDEIVRALE